MRQDVYWKDAPDFRRAAPESRILADQQSGYSEGRAIWEYNGYSQPVLTIMVGFQTAKKMRIAKELRVGFSFNSENIIAMIASKKTRHRFDTVIYPNGKVYFDSVRNELVSASIQSSSLLLDVSLICRFKLLKRLTAYTGPGLSFGTSINTSITTHYSSWNTLEANGRVYSTFGRGIEENEYFRGKSNYAGSFYIPVGLDFLLGRKRAIWKRIHLYVETRPGITFLIVPDIVSFSARSISASAGLRVLVN